MTKGKISDKQLAFCVAVAKGQDYKTAYLEQISGGKAGSKTAEANSSKMMRRPEIRAKVNELMGRKEAAIVKANIETLPPEFTGIALTIDQLDQLHYSIAKGVVEVEEVVPIVKKTRDKGGKITEETVNFMRVKRKANIRERQASVDALYKRFGSYAPSKLYGAFGRVGREEDENDNQNIQRFVLLSNGDKLNLP